MIRIFIALTLIGGFDLLAQPNFIFVLTDDQPYGYMGCTGNQVVKTPNLDQLASEGVLFTNAHVTSAICTPSRASILLSQHERKHGINFNSGTSLSEEGWEDTYPAHMRKAGYYSGWIGKNHVPVGQGGYKSGFMEQQFDFWYAGHGHLGFYPKKRHKIFENASSDSQVEIIAEGVENFLSNEQKMEGVISFFDARPDDQPFVLSVSFNLPHGAGVRSMEQRAADSDIYKSLYRDQDIPRVNHYLAKQAIETPKIPLSIHHVADRQAGYNYADTPAEVRERTIRQYQAMTGIDQMIGGMREMLKKQGLDKNTVIIFTSDHGLMMGQHGLGGKAVVYEQVTHVPMIVFDPKRKGKRGTKMDALVQTIDVAPTMLAMAGIPIPDSFQGEDLRTLLDGEVDQIRDYLFTENLWSTHFGNPRCEAVQNKDWKYIRYYANHNFSALKKIETAAQFDINVNRMLYTVHDPDIALYRDYIESPLRGEPAVFEELYRIGEDPYEVSNLSDNADYSDQLSKMRAVWENEIKRARGTGQPKVLRYTVESEAERGVTIQPE
ncbi:MAG: sulfatase-like hydrolase/transferase [Cyclobacteriaceae bacterium]